MSNDIPKRLQAALTRRSHTHQQACDEIGVESLQTFRNWLHSRARPLWDHAEGVLRYIGPSGGAYHSFTAWSARRVFDPLVTYFDLDDPSILFVWGDGSYVSYHMDKPEAGCPNCGVATRSVSTLDRWTRVYSKDGRCVKHDPVACRNMRKPSVV